MTSGKMIVEDGTVAGNVYDKYGTKNPLARYMVGNFLSSVTSLAEQVDPESVHEAGCGEGQLTLRLARPGRRVAGSDFSRQIIQVARDNLQGGPQADVDFKVSSIYDLRPPEDSASLVVCCEVLEHLEAPEEALAVLSRLASPHLLVSVPREPLWRVLNMARGKYLGDWGNTPGHLQHWSKRAFIGLLEKYLDVIQVKSPIPWTVCLCRTRRP